MKAVDSEEGKNDNKAAQIAFRRRKHSLPLFTPPNIIENRSRRINHGWQQQVFNAAGGKHKAGVHNRNQGNGYFPFAHKNVAVLGGVRPRQFEGIGRSQKIRHQAKRPR